MVCSLSSARGAAGKRKKECGQEFVIHKTTFFPLAFPGPSLSGTLQQVPIENPPVDHICPDLFSAIGYAAAVR
jgi:hypothetical protein